ncbi:HNH endonuclease [Streptomyces sp. NPDC052077]|uniref:HNH endonuclease n=1 Tax=Streptomyces sp. NPDC052077 TaxID=3154757 RepID=UPI0034191F25
MRTGDITQDAVLRAIAEYDRLGRTRFLEDYGYGESVSYVLVHRGVQYDSKAIAGVAHKWSQGRALRASEFSGGKDHAVAWLKAAGFEVKSVKDPDWARDEVILACRLVRDNGWRGLNADDQRVIELSGLLRMMPLHAKSTRTEKFRNPNGVARKTADIATRHPDYQGKPTNDGVVDIEVLNDFLARPEEMAAAARLIEKGITTGGFQDLPPETAGGEEDDYSAPEGRLLVRQHLNRERNRTLRKKKITAVLSKGGRLACEACGFDFEEVYGERGDGYIECHHVVPLHEAGEGRTKLSDLALICANCHRMIHRRAPWPTPGELHGLIEARRTGNIPLPEQRGGTSRPGTSSPGTPRP